MSVTGGTAGVYVCTASGDTVAGLLYVKEMCWVCTTASTAGDHLLVQDSTASGNYTMMDAYASGAYTRTLMPFHRNMNGITVASMTSGVFYIYTGIPRMRG